MTQNSYRGQYKYICEECEEATYFTPKQRTARAGMRCRHCGCRYLNPSKRSIAKEVLSIAQGVKTEQDALWAEKTNQGSPKGRMEQK